MDQKKTIAVVVGVAAVVMLFAVVYGQFRTENAAVPSKPSVQQKTMGGDVAPVAVPVAEPETPEDIATAIDAQLAEDAAALDAEVAAETAAVEEELNSLDEINDAYDENAY